MPDSWRTWPYQRPGAAFPPWLLKPEGEHVISAHATLSEAEVADYRYMRATQSSKQILAMFKRLIWLAATNLSSHVFARRLSVWAGMTSCAPSGLLYLLLKFQDRNLKRIMTEKPLASSAFVQLMVFGVIAFGCALGSPLMVTSVMQHRFFLATSVPVLVYYTMSGYVPFGRPCLFFGPIFFIAWLVFHYMVDFLNLSVVWYGLCACAVSLFTFEQADMYHWERYVMKATLSTQKQQLEKMQATLNGMLASLFDASCTCGQKGKLLSCTPQFRQLLADSQDCEGWDFGVFASDASEEERLRNFIAQAAVHATDRAAVLHASLQALPMSAKTASGSSRGGDDAPTAKAVRETTIYAIALPRGAGDTDGSEEGGLFIGLQTHARAVQDPVQDTTGRHDEEIVSDATQSDAAADVTRMESEDAGSDASRLGEMRDALKLSHLAARDMPQGDRREDAMDARSDRDEARSTAQWSVSEGGSSLRYSATAVSSQCSSLYRRRISRGSRGPPRYVDVETQTDGTAGKPPRGPPRYVDVETQTDGTAGKPPLHPKQAEQVSKRKALSKERPMPKRRICLGTSQRLVANFKQTPRTSAEQSIVYAMVHINACGVGCCKYHTALKNVARIVRDMQAGGCVKTWEPYNGWQCKNCLSLNDVDSDVDSEDSGTESDQSDRECDVCGEVGKPAARTAAHSSSHGART